MEERTNYLILVLCEDVSVEDLDEEMRPYLRTNTYLRRDSRWFWEKLKYAMPQKPLLELQRDRNLPQNADWSGLYAIARAQQVDSILVGGDKRPTINIHCGSHQQNRGKINDRLMACGMGDDIPQGRDDIPLVKSAHNYINTWIGVAQLQNMGDKMRIWLLKSDKMQLRPYCMTAHFCSKSYDFEMPVILMPVTPMLTPPLALSAEFIQCRPTPLSVRPSSTFFQIEYAPSVFIRCCRYFAWMCTTIFTKMFWKYNFDFFSSF